MWPADRPHLNRLQDTLEGESEKDVVYYRNRILYRLNYVINQIDVDYLRHALNELLRYFTMEEMKVKEFDEQWDIFSRQLLNNRKSAFDVLIDVPFKPQKRESQDKLPEILQKSGLDLMSFDKLRHYK